MIHEFAIIALLAIICFLLYQLYRLKYTEGKGKSEFIPQTLKKDLTELDDNKSKETTMRFRDMSSRISELERRIERNERVVEKLIEELG
jgi:hypothetical protein